MPPFSPKASDVLAPNMPSKHAVRGIFEARAAQNMPCASFFTPCAAQNMPCYRRCAAYFATRSSKHAVPRAGPPAAAAQKWRHMAAWYRVPKRTVGLITYSYIPLSMDSNELVAMNTSYSSYSMKSDHGCFFRPRADAAILSRHARRVESPPRRGPPRLSRSKWPNSR